MLRKLPDHVPQGARPAALLPPSSAYSASASPWRCSCWCGLYDHAARRRHGVGPRSHAPAHPHDHRPDPKPVERVAGLRFLTSTRATCPRGKHDDLRPTPARGHSSHRARRAGLRHCDATTGTFFHFPLPGGLPFTRPRPEGRRVAVINAARSGASSATAVLAERST